MGQSDSSNNGSHDYRQWSLWFCQSALDIGDGGWGNSLIISNGGQVYSGSSMIGRESSSNCIWVTGTGSTWSNFNTIVFGGGAVTVDVRAT